MIATVIKINPEREPNQFGEIRGIITFNYHWFLKPFEDGKRNLLS